MYILPITHCIWLICMYSYVSVPVHLYLLGSVSAPKHAAFTHKYMKY